MLGAVLAASQPPKGPPTSPTWSNVTTGPPTWVVRISFTSGDTTAQTELYIQGGALKATVAAGVTHVDVTHGGAPPTEHWTLKHLKNGYESSGVNVTTN